jgi:hypothetical protein
MRQLPEIVELDVVNLAFRLNLGAARENEQEQRSSKPCAE